MITGGARGTKFSGFSKRYGTPSCRLVELNQGLTFKQQMDILVGILSNRVGKRPPRIRAHNHIRAAFLTGIRIQSTPSGIITSHSVFDR